jgi:hypothetical protein
MPKLTHSGLSLSVFASRIATSKPVWDKRMRLYRYDRFAAGQIKGAEDPEQYEIDENKGLMKINWPPFNKAEVIERELAVRFQRGGVTRLADLNGWIRGACD